MNKYLCILICFLVGILIFLLIKSYCGCNYIVEGQSVGNILRIVTPQRKGRAHRGKIGDSLNNINNKIDRSQVDFDTFRYGRIVGEYNINNEHTDVMARFSPSKFLSTTDLSKKCIIIRSDGKNYNIIRFNEEGKEVIMKEQEESTRGVLAEDSNLETLKGKFSQEEKLYKIEYRRAGVRGKTDYFFTTEDGVKAFEGMTANDFADDDFRIWLSTKDSDKSLGKIAGDKINLLRNIPDDIAVVNWQYIRGEDTLPNELISERIRYLEQYLEDPSLSGDQLAIRVSEIDRLRRFNFINELSVSAELDYSLITLSQYPVTVDPDGITIVDHRILQAFDNGTLDQDQLNLWTTKTEEYIRDRESMMTTSRYNELVADGHNATILEGISFTPTDNSFNPFESTNGLIMTETDTTINISSEDDVKYEWLEKLKSYQTDPDILDIGFSFNLNPDNPILTINKQTYRDILRSAYDRIIGAPGRQMIKLQQLEKLITMIRIPTGPHLFEDYSQFYSPFNNSFNNINSIRFFGDIETSGRRPHQDFFTFTHEPTAGYETADDLIKYLDTASYRMTLEQSNNAGKDAKLVMAELAKEQLRIDVEERMMRNRGNLNMLENMVAEGIFMDDEKKEQLTFLRSQIQLYLESQVENEVILSTEDETLLTRLRSTESDMSVQDATNGDIGARGSTGSHMSDSSDLSDAASVLSEPHDIDVDLVFYSRFEASLARRADRLGAIGNLTCR